MRRRARGGRLLRGFVKGLEGQEGVQGGVCEGAHVKAMLGDCGRVCASHNVHQSRWHFLEDLQSVLQAQRAFCTQLLRRTQVQVRFPDKSLLLMHGNVSLDNSNRNQNTHRYMTNSNHSFGSKVAKSDMLTWLIIDSIVQGLQL